MISHVQILTLREWWILSDEKSSKIINKWKFNLSVISFIHCNFYEDKLTQLAEWLENWDNLKDSLKNIKLTPECITFKQEK